MRSSTDIRLPFPRSGVRYVIADRKGERACFGQFCEIRWYPTVGEVISVFLGVPPLSSTGAGDLVAACVFVYGLKVGQGFTQVGKGKLDVT